jgi:hypothetical protein
VIYDKFYNIDANGDFVDRVSPVLPGGNDENFNLFNVDAFFTWDFRLGSRLIVGYKNWLGDDEYVDGTFNRKYFKNLRKYLIYDMRMNSHSALFISSIITSSEKTLTHLDHPVICNCKYIFMATALLLMYHKMR